MQKSFKDSTFLIVGVARNCESTLKATCNALAYAFSNSAAFSFLIIESDSSDQTMKELHNLSDAYCLRYISLGRLQPKYSRRSERLAVCRNEYLREIRYNPIYKTIDYVVVADMDGVNLEVSSASIESCWAIPFDWDACFANQKAPYYDIWALRHDSWCPTDCFRQERFFRQQGVDPFLSRYHAVLSKMIRISRKTDPIQVRSAFGGLGIYKRSAVSHGEYSGIDENDSEICEHVPLHLNFMANMRLYINPKLINGGWNEHSRYRQTLVLGILFIMTRLVPISILKNVKASLKAALRYNLRDGSNL